MSTQTQDDAIQIHAWTAVGAMTPEAILARIDQNIIDKRTFRPSELAALRRNFQAVCDPKGQISKAEFTNFVLSKSSLPAALTDAVHVLFESLCYLSRTPLQSTPSSPLPPTTHLTLEGLTRALMWLLPSRVPSVITETRSGRMRSPADHRRLMFQSLATSRVAHAPEGTRSVASRREPRNQGAETNGDGHRDEMYHDILDTLASTQPYTPPAFAPPSRDTFHALATKLHEGAAPSLSSLAISKDRLTSFLSLLLANNFAERLLDVSPDLEAVAHAMAASFCDGRQDGQIVTWEMFDFAATELLPHVFDSLFNLLGTIFFDQRCDLDATQGHFPTAAGSAILTLPRMAQLESVLFNSLCMADIRLFDNYPHPTKTTAWDLVDAIEKIPECALLLVSGHTAAAHTTCTFGAFIARPLVDGPCIQRGEPGFEDTALLIQLSPVHDVFRGQVGQPAWAVTDGGLVFGNKESGAALVIDEGMAEARFMHDPFGGAGDVAGEAVYQTTEHRGKFSVPFTVERIELWGEDAR